MKLKQALKILNSQVQPMCSQFGVKHLSLFGSLARDEAKPESDLDILVEFETQPNFDCFMEL